MHIFLGGLVVGRSSNHTQWTPEQNRDPDAYTDRTLQLVNGGVHFFILVLKKEHVTQMVAKWRSFKQPCKNRG